VLVGLEREGEPVVGAVNIPALGDLLHAAQGQGCTWNGRPARVSTVSSLDESLLLSTDAESLKRYGRVAAYRRLAAATKMQRTWGDAYGYVLVATGRAEIMLDPIVSIWDCAALAPVLREAGGTCTDWRGVSTINNGELLGTNGLVLPQALALLNEADEDPYAA
jgi:fructose-1,6-bisphosphatase/inositol monophosphatase family enzyme